MPEANVLVETQSGHVPMDAQAEGPTSTKMFRGNPKDSMKSDWYTNPDRSDWTLQHWLIKIFDVYPEVPGREVPVHQKTDKVPILSWWQTNRWIMVHNAIPLLLHQLYVMYTGRNLGPIQAALFYIISFKVISIRQDKMLREVGYKTGFFDGDVHARDGIPNASVSKIFKALDMTSNTRPTFITLLSYRTALAPDSINWLTLLAELSVYHIVLDFYFYWYHRIMHESDALWKYHRTHHLTKHPNPLLTIFADAEQELFDIAIVPLATYFTMKAVGFPMGFYEWWICQQYLIFVEIIGHSGLRVSYTPAYPLTWLLTMLDLELELEDHDLHHRNGWKKSGNYGKQTRVWDRLFGTVIPRVERKEENVDYNDVVKLPLW